jgi:hypothetical protein
MSARTALTAERMGRIPITKGNMIWSTPTLRLTAHFTLEEMSFSEAAARLGRDNTPGSTAMANLTLVAACMETIRALVGDKSIVVHSGYRSTEVNRAVGGVSTSAHCQGWRVTSFAQTSVLLRKWRWPL